MKRAILVAVLVFLTSGAWALDEAALTKTLTTMGQAAGRTFQCEVMEDEETGEFNAWAGSDGKLGITPMMLETLQTNDQLAFVLGHEMTHVVAKHHKGQLKQSILGAVLGLVVAKVAGAKDEGDYELGAQVGAGIIGGRYSRKNEYKADIGAVDLSAKAGYQPEAGVEVLEILQKRSGNGTAKVAVIGWFASHPDTGERIKRIMTEIDKISKANSQKSSTNPTVSPTQPETPASSAYQR